MKTVSVTEFRKNIKRYLDIAQEEKLIIHRGKGPSFVLVPLEEIEEVTLLNEDQKRAINKAKEDIKEGKTYNHEQAIEILKERHPNYF
ncbi:MAG: type II toxin-antitoxin system Phd/YefM family antitoxin [Flavobacterium sp.]